MSVVILVFTALLGGAAANLGGSLGAVSGGQPTAPNLNPSNPIDPSSIERAYAALGLTYQGNQIQTQSLQPNMSNQALQGQAGMRPMNPMSKTWPIFPILSPISFRSFVGSELFFLTICALCILQMSCICNFMQFCPQLMLKSGINYIVFLMQRCKRYGRQWRCGCFCSEPTSQLVAGHHDAPQCEQPRVRGNLYASHDFSTDS